MISDKFIFILLFLILLLHVVAMVNFWYWSVWWFDIIMHFLGGFWVALLFFNLNSKFNFLPDNLLTNNLTINNLTILVLALGFVALIAVCWEFFEFLYDVFISSKGYSGVAQLGVADTIGDLFFGLLGGLIASIIIRMKQKINL